MNEEQEVVDSAEITTNDESYEQDDSIEEGEGAPQAEESKQRQPETPEQRKARIKRMYEREFGKQDTKNTQEDSQKGNDESYLRLDLKTEGVKDTKEQDIVLNYMKEKALVGSPVTVEQALKSAVVREELEAIRVKTSVPRPSNRTGSGQSDGFDYWVKEAKKGNFPTSDPVMMKRLEKARIW